MIDLAIVTANVARDRVAEQFHSAPATDAPARPPWPRCAAPPSAACGRSPIASRPRRASRRRPDGRAAEAEPAIA